MELAVHLPDGESYMYEDGKEIELAVGADKLTPLKAYFQLNNQAEGDERDLLRGKKFVQIPELYLIHKESKEWVPKGKCPKPTIGCLYPVSPKNKELFFLRALIQKKCFPLSFEDLRIVDGVQHRTFRDAAVAMGLVRGDEEFATWVLYMFLTCKITLLFCMKQLSERGGTGRQSFQYETTLPDDFAALLSRRPARSLRKLLGGHGHGKLDQGASAALLCAQNGSQQR
jgi:hypothetical protein